MFIKGMLVGQVMNFVDMGKVINLVAKPKEQDKPDGDWTIIASSAIILAQGSKELILFLMIEIHESIEVELTSLDLQSLAKGFARFPPLTQEKP